MRYGLGLTEMRAEAVEAATVAFSVEVRDESATQERMSDEERVDFAAQEETRASVKGYDPSRHVMKGMYTTKSG